MRSGSSACLVKDRIGWRKIRVYDKRISLNLRQRDIDRILAYNSYVLLEQKGIPFAGRNPWLPWSGRLDGGSSPGSADLRS